MLSLGWTGAVVLFWLRGLVCRQLFGILVFGQFVVYFPWAVCLLVLFLLFFLDSVFGMTVILMGTGGRSVGNGVVAICEEGGIRLPVCTVVLRALVVGLCGLFWLASSLRGSCVLHVGLTCACGCHCTLVFDVWPCGTCMLA
jgi:hypothetical protein